jgi:hypothetical protein
MSMYLCMQHLDTHMYACTVMYAFVHTKCFCVWVGRAENKAKQFFRSLMFEFYSKFFQTPCFKRENRVFLARPTQMQSTLCVFVNCAAMYDSDAYVHIGHFFVQMSQEMDVCLDVCLHVCLHVCVYVSWSVYEHVCRMIQCNIIPIDKYTHVDYGRIHRDIASRYLRFVAVQYAHMDLLPIHAYVFEWMRTYVATYFHTYIHTRMHGHIHTYIHTYVYMHTCIHTYIHT